MESTSENQSIICIRAHLQKRLTVRFRIRCHLNQFLKMIGTFWLGSWNDVDSVLKIDKSIDN